MDCDDDDDVMTTTTIAGNQFGLSNDFREFAPDDGYPQLSPVSVPDGHISFEVAFRRAPE